MTSLPRSEDRAANLLTDFHYTAMCWQFGRNEKRQSCWICLVLLPGHNHLTVVRTRDGLKERASSTGRKFSVFGSSPITEFGSKKNHTFELSRTRVRIVGFLKRTVTASPLVRGLVNDVQRSSFVVCYLQFNYLDCWLIPIQDAVDMNYVWKYGRHLLVTVLVTVTRQLCVARPCLRKKMGHHLCQNVMSGQNPWEECNRTEKYLKIIF